MLQRLRRNLGSTKKPMAGILMAMFAVCSAWAAPEMMVVGNSVEIVDGDSSPETADHTDFGYADVTVQSITQTFVISNTGADPLSLSGSPRVEIGGTHAGDFSVTLDPAASVAGLSSDTFEVTFNPTATGVRSATISIVNNDSNENPYNFAIQGTGFNNDDPVAVTDASDPSGNTGSSVTLSGSGSYDPDSLPNALTYSWTFTSGPSTPTITDDDQETATFTPSAAGVYVFTLTVSDGVGSDNENATVYVSVPEIAVSGNSTNIADGDSTPGSGDNTTFAATYIGETPTYHTFIIENVGASSLNLTGSPLVEIAGTHPSDFNVTTEPGSAVSAGSSTSFIVRFDPQATGTRTAIVSIANNDSDENPFTFAIQGEGVARPEIRILGNGQVIVDGDDEADDDDHTDFGSTGISGGRITRTFTIENTGAGPLGLTDADIVDINAIGDSAFEVTVLPDTTIAAGGSATFQITFNPDVTGDHYAEVEIDNNDSDENPYTFTIKGHATLFNYDDGDDGGCNTAMGAANFGLLLPLFTVFALIFSLRRRKQ